MQIKLRGNQVAVEKLKKQAKRDAANFLTMPDAEEYLGIIRHLGPDAGSDLVVGQRAYFSTTFQNFRMAGSEYCVMEDKNILAVVQDEAKQEETPQS